mgnify:CR=1 FL=1|tara:strand:+ start:878 stop:1375 length:498 start_codon:yes stop_codon:yes gene_type:complete
MKKSQKISKLENRKDRTHYTGKYSSFQEFGSSYKGKRYSQYEQDPYNEYQNFLYKRALFGLKMYTQEEIKEMHSQKRKRIVKVNKRAQNVLNLWKQEKIIAYTNIIFGKFDSVIANDIVAEQYSMPDPKFKCDTSFKDLKIEKKDIVDKLVKEGVLPPDFNNLKK